MDWEKRLPMPITRMMIAAAILYPKITDGMRVPEDDRSAMCGAMDSDGL